MNEVELLVILEDIEKLRDAIDKGVASPQDLQLYKSLHQKLVKYYIDQGALVE